MKITGRYYLTREAAFNWIKCRKFKYGLDLHFNHNISSRRRIDIIIPVIQKDLNVLPYVIDSARNNIKHPINKIFIVAPEIDEIVTLTKEKKCIFIDERTVLGFGKEKINYKVNGIDRSGWLFQQLLKLSGDKISEKSFFLVLDADTVFIRPKVFRFLGCTIFDCSNEFHPPYFSTFASLTGMEHKFPLSFICHYMLFSRKYLDEFKQVIEEKTGQNWVDAIINRIDETERSCFSEYESYANFMWQNHRCRMVIEYWWNKSLNKKELINIETLKEELSEKNKSISFHSYNN